MAWRVVAVLLFGGLLCGACGGGDDPPPPGLTADGEIDIPALVEFVESQRGKTFDREPVVEFVDDPGAMLVSGIDWDTASASRARPRRRPRADSRRPDSPKAGGSCCPGQVTPGDDVVDAAGVIVHELVHLIDDSVTRFPSSGPRLPEAAHVTAFVEGLATMVQADFLALHGVDLFEDQESRRPPGLPPGLVAMIEFPYNSGSELARRLDEQGGAEALDEAYGSWPRSAEQVAHPDAYLGDEAPTPVEAPPLGDGSALWYPDDEVCLTAAIEMDDADAAEMLTARIVSSRPELAADQDGSRITLERCLPDQ